MKSTMNHEIETLDLDAPLTDDCRERVITVFRAIWASNYKVAEEETGIGAAKWKRLCMRAQQPTIEMIEALAKTRPYFLVWMMTGKAETYFQLSPNDRWQDKLARAMGVNVDKRQKEKTQHQ